MEKKYKLIVHIDKDKYDGKCSVDFVFGGEHHKIEITNGEFADLDFTFHKLWANGRIHQGLVPGGKCYGLFQEK